jgi:prolyl oligopeptidase
MLAACLAGLLPTGCTKKPEATMAAADAFDTTQHDWLEEIEGARALEWVRGQNERSLAVLTADPRYQAFHDEAFRIITSKDRIPYGSIRDGYVWNFWKDERNPLGIWRRVRTAEYARPNPRWETILDVDALSAREGKKWVWGGASCHPANHDVCLVSLSEGGKDASVRREFSVSRKAFVEGGFSIPEAKSRVSWGPDTNTLYVATDWGQGSLTVSGYPFVVKTLRRGQPLSAATEVYRGETSDQGGTGAFYLEDNAGHRWMMAARGELFFATTYVLFPEAGGAPVVLPIPKKASPEGLHDGLLLVTLREDWTPEGQGAFKSGDLVAFNWAEFVATGKLPAVQLVFHPTARQAIQGVSITRSSVLLTISDNVVPKVVQWTHANGAWTQRPVALPENGAAGVVFADIDTDDAFLTYDSYLSPDTLYLYNAASGQLAQQLQLPAWFDASTMVAEQFEATSSDGVKIPYFVVHKKDMPLNGQNPTLLYAYGGFEVSYPPSYSAVMGKLWLENGGVYALANIRGGGEFGPAWHEAGLKTHRQIIYDDFAAVAQDLIARNITSPRRLGAMGGSNGGLLMGVMFIQHPELFNAIVCQVPLLDMINFPRLGAGASWMDEYGNPDDANHPEERTFLQSISPYHNVRSGVTYPEIFLETSTKDDRVHPGHARKMAHRLADLNKPFLYYENIDGGHAAASTPDEVARRSALEYVYLARKLMDP